MANLLTKTTWPATGKDCKTWAFLFLSEMAAKFYYRSKLDFLDSNGLQRLILKSQPGMLAACCKSCSGADFVWMDTPLNGPGSNPGHKNGDRFKESYL